MRLHLLIFLLIVGGLFSGNTQIAGQDCANPIAANVFPYSHSGNTANYGNNYTGVPSANCQTLNPYLSGNEVVYHFVSATNLIVKKPIFVVARFSYLATT